MNARADAVQRLQRRLGYEFKDRALLEQSLTHASVAGHSPKTSNNQVLEFLGDRVIGLLAAERLAELFPDAREGELTLRFHALVRNEACAEVAGRMGLGEALRTSGGGRMRPSVLGDAAEAVMGAVYVEGGIEAARSVFLDLWSEQFAALGASTLRDPKNILQEWAQGGGRPLPAYVVVARTGPAHKPLFTVSVTVQGLAPAVADGPTRQEAEKAAATSLLAREKLA